MLHYQLPRSAEVYVHRSGRTARGGACGLSIAFVEPADHKAHRRLCSELGVPDGLPELSVESRLLPKVREVVSIARQLDKASHAQSKRGRDAKKRKQLAEEMDLPTDSDDEDPDGGDESSRLQARRQQAQTEKLRANLKRLLGRIERPTGVPVHVVAKTQQRGQQWS